MEGLLLLLVGYHLLVLRSFALVRFKADLKNPVAEGIAVEALDGDNGFLVVGHCDKAEALALICLQIANHLDRLDGTKGSKELPQDVLLGLWSQVVDKDAPAGSIHRVPRQHRICKKVSCQRTVPETGGRDSLRTLFGAKNLEGFSSSEEIL